MADEAEGESLYKEEAPYNALMSATYQNAVNRCCAVPPPPQPPPVDASLNDPCKIPCPPTLDAFIVNMPFKADILVKEDFAPRKKPHYPPFPDFYYCFVDENLPPTEATMLPSPDRTPCWNSWDRSGYTRR